ncbi:MAG: HflC protein [Spirochaeta sp. LUC14_002_19_P3]|nr:MAG: HflC protein [Spirochaeta sp. LUC14_002_19_P3]
MNTILKTIFPVVIIAALLMTLRPFFIIPEGEQAVVTRFGRIVEVHTEAGLKLKLPAVDKVTRYSKKILSWDGDPQRMPTSENQYIWVDTTARWRIVDPTVFYQRVNVMDEAYARLDNVIESAVRTVVSQYPLTESVRSTNIILESDNVILDFQTNARAEADAAALAAESGENLQEAGTGILESAFAPIQYGRKTLSNEMLKRSLSSMPEYGMELLDVVIRQIRYSDDLTQSVYDRMISERQKVATGYRSDGNGLKAEWLGQLNRDRDIKLTEAETRAALIRAEGDAEAARIYAEAYNADPEFYSFWKALESYQKVLPGQKKVLSTDMDFFRYLYSQNGR